MDQDLIECIYCMEQKPPAAFTREHVVPESFGTFGHDTFVLNKEVCGDCNQEFGDTIDRDLARDSMEGRQRFSSGIMRPTKKHRFGLGERLITTLDGGECDGAFVEERRPEDGSAGLVLHLLKQVGVSASEDGPWKWYKFKSLPTWAELRPAFPGGICLKPLGCTDEEARELLIRKGFDTNGRTKFFSEEVLFEPYSKAKITTEARFDERTARAVAKIVFNYFAYHYPKKARMHQFEGLRRFVRWGKGNWRSFVRVTKEPVLAIFPRDAQVFAHAVTVFWDQPSRAIIGQVTLFNWVQYKVLLGHGFACDEHSVKSAHLFDPANRESYALTTQKGPMVPLSEQMRIED